jgi:hypothetical protein
MAGQRASRGRAVPGEAEREQHGVLQRAVGIEQQRGRASRHGRYRGQCREDGEASRLRFAPGDRDRRGEYRESGPCGRLEGAGEARGYGGGARRAGGLGGAGVAGGSKDSQGQAQQCDHWDVCAACRHLQRYGRRGQRENGVAQCRAPGSVTVRGGQPEREVQGGRPCQGQPEPRIASPAGQNTATPGAHGVRQPEGGHERFVRVI